METMGIKVNVRPATTSTPGLVQTATLQELKNGSGGQKIVTAEVALAYLIDQEIISPGP